MNTNKIKNDKLFHPSLSSNPQLSHPKYRADIDGLRAIAVLSVVGFHAFPDWVKGGFIGVDIFFVISGFLISTIIFENLERNSFSFVEFYIRRVKRIFPALLLVLTVTFAFGWYVLLSDEYKQLGKHTAAGAGFISNFVLWNESGYFDNAAETKPLLHLWSLGIEEQFYIIWPLLIWFAWKRQFNLLLLISMIIAFSFSLNILTINQDPVATFYSPQTRFWELLFGSFLAYLTLFKQNLLHFLKLFSANQRSFFGTLLLMVGISLITREKVFPGWWAVVPTTGATLIISAGSQAWLNRVVFSNKVLVWFGLISFPLYLWHWPLISFAKIIENGIPSREMRIGIIFLSILLAWLTYIIVERPIRFGNKKEKIFPLIVIMLSISLFGLLAYFNVTTPRNKNQTAQTIVQAVNDWDYPSGLSHKEFSGENLYFLKGKSEITLMIGDSHIMQYSPRVIKLKQKYESNLNSVFWAAIGGCPPIPKVHEDSNKGCNKLLDASLKFLELSKVKKVVIGGCWNCYFAEEELSNKDTYVFIDGEKVQLYKKRGKEYALIELQSLLEKLRKSKKVYLLLDNPAGKNYSPDSFFKGSRLTEIKSKPMSQYTKITLDQLKLRDQLIGIARRAGVEIIDPTEKLCSINNCLRSTEDGTPIYSSRDHLRPFFVRDEANYFDPAFFSN